MLSWWFLPLAIGAAFLALSFLPAQRRKRLTVTVEIPERGEPRVFFDPARPASYDLSLAVLCYASKVRWLLRTEPAEVLDAFREMCAEAIDSWNKPGADLLDRMKWGTAWPTDEVFSRAVKGGESFVVTLYRTEFKTLRNRAHVVNSLPRNGLAANIPFSTLLVLNGAFALMDDGDRARLHAAFADWHDTLFDSNSGLIGLSANSVDLVNAAFLAPA